jgi:hypothetical protein
MSRVTTYAPAGGIKSVEVHCVNSPTLWHLCVCSTNPQPRVSPGSVISGLICHSKSKQRPKRQPLGAKLLILHATGAPSLIIPGMVIVIAAIYCSNGEVGAYPLSQPGSRAVINNSVGQRKLVS